MEASVGSRWDFSTETLVGTCKAIMRPILNHDSPIWFRKVYPFHLDKLEIIHNKTLWIVTNCHQNPAVSYLRTESSLRSHQWTQPKNWRVSYSLPTCLHSRSISIISILYLQSRQGHTPLIGPRRDHFHLHLSYFHSHLISPDDPEVDPFPLNNNRPRTRRKFLIQKSSLCQLRQQRSSEQTAHTTGTSIFKRGSSLRFIRFV